MSSARVVLVSAGQGLMSTRYPTWTSVLLPELDPNYFSQFPSLGFFPAGYFPAGRFKSNLLSLKPAAMPPIQKNRVVPKKRASNPRGLSWILRRWRTSRLVLLLFAKWFKRTREMQEVYMLLKKPGLRNLSRLSKCWTYALGGNNSEWSQDWRRPAN